MTQKIRVNILFIVLLTFFTIYQVSAQTGTSEENVTYQNNEKEVKAQNDLWNQTMECFRAVAAKVEDVKCLKCHTNLLDKETYSKQTPPVVRIHYFHYKESGMDLTCTTCHERMDPFNDSGATLRKQVDPFICYNCHEPFSKVSENK